MDVTPIIGGDDHFTNAFRQTKLYEALGWKVPVMVHIPLIHGPDGGKLSKCHGTVDVQTYQHKGILPKAMENALLRLGWAYGDNEKISRKQVLEWLRVEGLSSSCSRFDEKKLFSLNVLFTPDHTGRSLRPIRFACISG